MRTYRHLFITALCLGFYLSGCSASGTPTTIRTGDLQQSQMTGLLEFPPESFNAQFEITFDGNIQWLYSLKIRNLPPTTETILHIEGIDKTRNPGDIRVVTDGKTTWMIGEGTDNECIMFPNHQGMDPDFITPGSLFIPGELELVLANAGEQTVGEKTFSHYTGNQITIGNWHKAVIDVWQDPATKALAGLRMVASGEDQFFGAGSGTINVQYAIFDAGSAPIEPVIGCEINVPIPETAVMFVRLPGLASFETTMNIDEVVRYYQEKLPQSGWLEKESPQQNDNEALITYAKGSEGVTVQIESTGAGSKVKLAFMTIE